MPCVEILTLSTVFLTAVSSPTSALVEKLIARLCLRCDVVMDGANHVEAGISVFLTSSLYGPTPATYYVLAS